LTAAVALRAGVFRAAFLATVFAVFLGAAARGRFAATVAPFLPDFRTAGARFRTGRFGADFAFVGRLRIAIGFSLDRRIAAKRAAAESLAPRVHRVNQRCRPAPP
jgi:hypothetical protein